jgi:fatty acid desaturase
VERVQVCTSAERIPSRVNVALALCYTGINLFQFFAVPLWLLRRDESWAWALLPLALLSNPYWSLLHEAIHDLFYPASGVNALFGRALSVMFGSPFRILRMSHLLHHKLNRTPREATELYERGKSSFTGAAASYYFQILGGLYLVEFMSSALFFLPRHLLRRFAERHVNPQSVSAILMQNWTRDDAIAEIRMDGALVLIWFGAAACAYGDHWPLLAAVVAARALLISFLDNVYHYRTPVNDIFYAKNLWLPGAAAKLLLNFNLHGIHHRHPAVPWRGLAGLFCEQAEQYQGNYFTAAAAQLCGPIASDELPGSGVRTARA